MNRKIIKRIKYWIVNKLDNFTIKKKLLIVYVFCMIVPLVITDSVILGIVFTSEQKTRRHEMENIANAVEYNLLSQIDSASKYAKNIYTSKYINDYLNKRYQSEQEYVANYQQLFKDTLLNVGANQSNMKIRMYADNDTIINGAEFQRIDKILSKSWYNYMTKNKLENGLYFEYDEDGSSVSKSNRKIYYFQKMNFYSNTNNVLVIEIDYRSMIRMLEGMKYDSTVYICDGNRIILSNGKYGDAGKKFEIMRERTRIGYSKEISICGKDLNIYVFNSKKSVFPYIIHQLPLIFLMILVNVMLPFFMVYLINHSFTVRIGELIEVFNKVDEENLEEIENPKGQDELGNLMRNYNRMVRRVNELIQIVYKNRIREQEILVAKQKMELLALHSQINPHFLFNALESIRMHSIIKKEIETADMVQKLAVMQRQYVEWQEDIISIAREMDFVKAYLGLQKYRFGDRLSYKLDVEDDCEQLQIPKLSIVTFVENACVHGIESKGTPGWIFVRIFKEDENVCLEIEDTGSGMDEEKANILLERMTDANIDMLQSKGRVGIVNACLRLKMITNDEVHFELESEEGVGTLIQIQIPYKFLETEQTKIT